MNYGHAFHAGNFADVLKHVALVGVIAHLKKKDTPFAVIDTHAGGGAYDLASEDARKTGEAQEGIGRLLDASDCPGVLASYVALVRKCAPLYPGSPLMAAKLLRPKDRLVAIEAEDGAFATLTATLAPYGRARVAHGDGYAALKRLLPPNERRGAILIDPPYETSDEFRQATAAVIDAHHRFANGIVLFWYPAKHRPMVAAAAGELMTAGIGSLMCVELDVGARPEPVRADRGPPLSATGLLVVNPPYGFAEEMRAVVAFLAARLAQGPGPAGTVEILAER